MMMLFAANIPMLPSIEPIVFPGVPFISGIEGDLWDEWSEEEPQTPNPESEPKPSFEK